MKSIRLFSTLLLLLITAIPTFAADWPCWRGPAQDGISQETGLLKSWPAEGPKVLWSAPLGGGYSSMAVADGRVFTMFQDAANQYVVAVDEKTGDELWRTPTGPIFTCKTKHNGPRSTPTVDGEMVYAVDGNGVLVCLKVSDGKEVWKKNILELAGAANAFWGISQSPYISGNLLLLNPGGTKGAALMAFDKKTGNVVWKTGNSTVGYSTAMTFKGNGKDQFVFFTGDSLMGVDVKSGTLLWSYPWQNKNNVNAAIPIALDNMIFASTGYGKGAIVIKVEPGKSQDEPTTASKVWEGKQLECHFGTPILIGDCLYGYSNAKLTCIDFKTGAVKWTDNEKVFPPKGMITCAEGLFYLLGENGELALAKLDPAKHELLGSVKIVPGAERWAAPVVANGRLYVRDDEKLLCLDIKAR